MKRTITALTLAAAVFAVAPKGADAQASITATATVAGALVINAGNDLDFGVVVPGFAKAIAVNDPTAGTFDISGGAGAEVVLTFTSLPANLDDGLGNLLDITYTGVHNTTASPTAGATGFTPSAGATTNLSGTGALYIYLGGSVNNAAGSPTPGTYTGTVTLSAAYTGN